MRTLFKGGMVFYRDSFSVLDLLIDDGVIIDVSPDIVPAPGDDIFYLGNTNLILPGFADVHVHFREPGFSYKETIARGSSAAAHGGFTGVCVMPNVSPAPDCIENLAVMENIISSDAIIDVRPIGCITKGQTGRSENVDYMTLAPHVAAFSDDGKGVQNDGTMEIAMREIKKLDGLITAHCEDERLLCGGCIHDGEYAKRNNFVGISSESEWGQVKRDIDLVEKTGCRYHVCHVSTKESVQLIRRAKARGLPVSCETAPHYLVLCDEDIEDNGKFKMNPPIRACEDRASLIEGLADGTIDCIATDHAPHSKKEKSGGLKNSLMGVVGLETAFPIIYTYLVKTKKLDIETVIRAMSTRPREIFRMGSSEICVGQSANFSIWKTETEEKVNTRRFLSKGCSTPFDGWSVDTLNLLTIYKGKVVYQNQHFRGDKN